jgi:hypothetical protein
MNGKLGLTWYTPIPETVGPWKDKVYVAIGEILGAAVGGNAVVSGPTNLPQS